MAIKKPYPRSTLRRIIKAHSNRNMSKNADILVYIDYALFIQHLLQEASVRAKSNNKRKVTADDIRDVTEKSMMKFKA